MSEKNKKIFTGVVVVIIIVVVFFVGVSYGKGQTPARGTQALGAGNFAGRMGGARGASGAGGFTAGQIIAKDATSITVQLMTPGGANDVTSGTPGGSKIVFLGTGTTVTKTVAGTITDLAVGTNVSVTGTPNTDGSENATSVQIRPASVVK